MSILIASVWPPTTTETLRSERLGWLVKLRWVLWVCAFASVGLTDGSRWVMAVLFGSALAVAVVVDVLGLDPEPDEISPEEIARTVRLKRLTRVVAAGVGVLTCVVAIRHGLSDTIAPGVVAAWLAIASFAPVSAGSASGPPTDITTFHGDRDNLR